MSAIAHVARACVVTDHDTLHVAAIAGFAQAAASMLLLHYGSFARALAAIGLSPAG